jgi:hypothetical protein
MFKAVSPFSCIPVEYFNNPEDRRQEIKITKNHFFSVPTETFHLDKDIQEVHTYRVSEKQMIIFITQNNLPIVVKYTALTLQLKGFRKNGPANYYSPSAMESNPRSGNKFNK